MHMVKRHIPSLGVEMQQTLLNVARSAFRVVGTIDMAISQEGEDPHERKVYLTVSRLIHNNHSQ